VFVHLAPAWRDYRNRLAVLVLAIVGLVLWADGLDGVLSDVLGSDAVVHAIAAGWLTLATGALVWYGAFRCPFCEERFHWTLWVINPIADRCLHCGFRKWRDPQAARALDGRR
jgi:hypothetical protein